MILKDKAVFLKTVTFTVKNIVPISHDCCTFFIGNDKITSFSLSMKLVRVKKRVKE